MGAPINDQFAGLNISRQRRYQLRKKAKGLCVQCGESALPAMTRCAPCRKLNYNAVIRYQGPPAKQATNTKFTRATAALNVES